MNARRRLEQGIGEHQVRQRSSDVGGDELWLIWAYFWTGNTVVVTKGSFLYKLLVNLMPDDSHLA